MAASLSSTFAGRVVSVNPKGLRLDGHAEWLNVSRYAVGVVLPERGQTVSVTTDRQRFIRAITAVNGSDPSRRRRPRLQLPRARRTAPSPAWPS
jgi:hypothetical protein